MKGLNINLGHYIQPLDSSIVAGRSTCINWVIRNVMEVELCPNNMNREDGFCMSKSWKPLIFTVKYERRLSIWTRLIPVLSLAFPCLGHCVKSFLS
jgi:hypothetical protein